MHGTDVKETGLQLTGFVRSPVLNRAVILAVLQSYGTFFSSNDFSKINFRYGVISFAASRSILHEILYGPIPLLIVIQHPFRAIYTTARVPLVDQELLTTQANMRSLSVFIAVSVAQIMPFSSVVPLFDSVSSISLTLVIMTIQSFHHS